MIDRSFNSLIIFMLMSSSKKEEDYFVRKKEAAKNVWASMTLKMFSILLALFSAFCCVSVTTAQSICGTSSRSASISYFKYLASPYYPSDYPPLTTCEWIITAPSGYRVELSFVTFNTEGSYSSGSCFSYSDILEVYDGRYRFSSKLRGKYCNNYLPANVYSSDTSLYLRFVSDSSSQRKGFNIKYKAVKPKPDSTICSPFNTYSQNNNIQLSGSSGYIESPLYGTKYPSNMQCTWVITVPDGKKIKLTLSNFMVGQDYYCSTYSTDDKLQIRDGKYSYSTSLKTLCGNRLPSPVSSSGRYLWIRFKSNSDNYNTRSTTGFKAKYETVSDSDNNVGLVVGVVIAVCIVIFLVCICVCVAHRKRTPGNVTVRAPTGTQTTTVQGIQNPAVTACQYPQQTQGGFVTPPYVGYSSPPQSSYPPPSTGYPQPPQGSYQYHPPGSYPMSTTVGGTSAPGYPPQSSVPMMPYPQQAIPNDPPPAYPGPPAYPPQAFTGQPAPSNPNPPYSPPQGAETQQPSPPYAPQAFTGQPAPSINPDPPYSPPQGAETQQSSPPYAPQAFTGQPAPSNPDPPYSPPQVAETQQSSPPYPPQAFTGQPAPSNPDPPYPPPQGAETQQSSPPYPPAQDTKQATAPPPF